MYGGSNCTLHVLDLSLKGQIQGHQDFEILGIKLGHMLLLNRNRK